jgi:hypothetical protein
MLTLLSALALLMLGACLGFFAHALLSSTKTAEDCAACKLEHNWVA